MRVIIGNTILVCIGNSSKTNQSERGNIGNRWNTQIYNSILDVDTAHMLLFALTEKYWL